MANTITVETLYEPVLQDRLDHPQTWKEMCDVIYTNVGVISSSYESTQAAVTTVTQGTGFIIQDFAQTAETLTISTGRDLGEYVDFRDLYQSPWTTPLEKFDRIGKKLNEFIESSVLAQHGSWTNIGDSNGTIASGVTTAITVSASNIDDIIRAVKRIIRKANGQALMGERGVGFVWRPEEFELLEAFTQANGNATADKYLVDGTVEGLKYLGCYHYFSNEHAAGHVFAGVRKVQRLGILKGTYGMAKTVEFPAGSSNNNLSGVLYYSRVDIGHLTPTAHVGLVFDINVN